MEGKRDKKKAKERRTEGRKKVGQRRKITILGRKLRKRENYMRMIRGMYVKTSTWTYRLLYLFVRWFSIFLENLKKQCPHSLKLFLYYCAYLLFLRQREKSKIPRDVDLDI